ncbi:HET-domain-containing protein [Eremomyces bilateralis CBS 781.70]|uniref:HET-domain-containing protein n=1 Tax=Eremomyces bilateralis CBS 781.70 TaxID=1392243 RepID=A0A6G1FWZ7_9PEZI|nr:HET-domain-containing protein [Eremomyces bilateralis CBS 781.70]KAF1810149.1 HET-domain-containing protein [Eremomyces bilateralis CBS 781.70]
MNQNSTSYLCWICRSLFKEDYVKPNKVLPFFDHHVDISSLEASANEKCYICLRLMEALCYMKKDSEAQCSFNTQCYIANLDKTPGQIYVAFYVYQSKRWMKTLPFRALPSQSVKKDMATFDLPTSTSRPRTLDQARQWLSCCLSEHKACSRVPDHWLPTRLVEVRKSGSIFAARLCYGSDLNSETHYLTLSHCWGKTPFFVLTRDNHDQMVQSIPIASLSPIFADAMRITVGLGYKYLWIDSLCIIQQEPGSLDWLKESLTMHLVYGNGVCNLAASGFSDGKEGLLLSSDIRDIQPPEADFARVSVGPIPPKRAMIILEEYGTDVLQAPLHQRAWVYQEQIMAPRILHFARRQMYWECRSKLSSELFPKSCPDTVMDSQWPSGAMNPVYASLLDLSFTIPTEHFYDAWCRIVEMYSNASLTYSTDKFPALSGLAKSFVPRLKDEYLAGMWRRDLHCELLWYIHDDGEPSSTYRAPTWSWASVDGRIYFLRRRYGTWSAISRILDVITVPVSQDLTGQLKGGHLRIRGLLRQVRLASVPKGDLDNKCFSLENEERSSSPDSGPAPLRLRQRGGPHPDAPPLDILVNPCIPNIWHAEEVFFMPVIYYPSEIEGSSTFEGLVLAPEKSMKGTYKKIGVFFFYRTTVEAAFAPDTAFDERYHEDFDGSNEYTIRII